MTRAEIESEILDNILTGGNRTTAAGVREVLGDLLDSYPNVEDGGFVFVPEIGYTTELSLSDPKSFAHKKYVDDAVGAVAGGIPWDAVPGYMPYVTGVNGFGYINAMEPSPLKKGGFYTQDLYGELTASAGSPSAFTFLAKGQGNSIASVGLYNTADTPGAGVAYLNSFDSTGLNGTQLVSSLSYIESAYYSLVGGKLSAVSVGVDISIYSISGEIYMYNNSSIPIGSPGVLAVDSGGRVYSTTLSTGTVESISIATANGFQGTSDGDPTNPELSIGTTVTGLLKGNGSAVSAAVAGTDYAAPSTTLAGYGITNAYTIAQTDAAISAATVGLLDDRGNFTPSGNYPSSGGSGTAGAILKGDLWTISGLGVGVTGTMGSKTVTDGDVVRALQDSPGNTDANWAIGENNFGYTALNAAMASGTIYVGNISGIGTAVTPTGDVTISNTGVTAIGALKVTNAMLAGSIDNSKLSNSTISGIALGSNLNNLSISAELISGGATTYNGSTAKSIAIQSGSITNAMLAGSIDLTTKVTGVLPGANGGTGVANTGFTITIAGNFITTGAFTSTFAASATATYTLPSATSTLLANNLGISGGTTYIGGTAATNVVIFQSTSGNQTVAAANLFTWKSGNNGAQTLMNIGDHPSTGIGSLGMWYGGQSSAATAFMYCTSSTTYLNSNNDTRVRVGNADYIVCASGTATVSVRQALTMFTAKSITLAAGTTTVQPLLFQSGTNLTTAVAGSMEYNGTNLFFTRTGTTREYVMVGAAGATAPATNTIGVVVDYYGTSSTRVLTTPNTWITYVEGGTTYKIPAYT